MVKREKNKLIINYRLGLRALGSGRKEEMDETDENFSLTCIQNKATAHGRRHDSVLYLNHRVKKKDLLKLVNHSRADRGLGQIRSATTAYNRARPKNVRSVQARQHQGLGLFCCKKPPKAEDNSNELTHYLRAFRKNVTHFLCGSQNSEAWKFNLLTSHDDKAYICPATSTGMNSSRKQKILQPSDQDQSRKLPKYDFPVNMINITPASHRIMNKEVHQVHGKDEVKLTEDQSVVFVRPKYFVGSSGSVWGSEIIELRHLLPRLYLSEKSNYSQEFLRLVVIILDSTELFIDSTERDDVLLVTNKDNCKQYELQRLSIFEQYCLKSVKDNLNRMGNEVFDSEKEKLINLLPKINQILALVQSASTALVSKCYGNELWNRFVDIVNSCRDVLQYILSFRLPAVKSHVMETTDAGPGVSVSNHDVCYRAAQRIRIMKLDYYIRLHLAPGDSSMNDVEQIQSYVGDAICDGGSLKWKYKTVFSDLTQDEVESLTANDITEKEFEVMKFNAFKVCEEVKNRCNGATAPGGYLKAFVSKPLDEIFFCRQAISRRIHLKEKRQCCPRIPLSPKD